MASYRKDKNAYLSDSTTVFEVVMLADKYGNLVGSANPSGTAVDAFGRARSSQPFTLFESFNRYQENSKYSTALAGSSTKTFDANSSSVLLSNTTTSGDEVIRESNRVFAYQPGKSLLILHTFVMDSPKTNLRQRVGYFNSQNGIFFQQNGSTYSFVRRSFVSGSVVDTAVDQSSWNLDKLDGTGPSRLTADFTKAQIMFIDIEWLGVGSVRCGFIINGQYVHCHSFHHSNIIASTYMTTACLPSRMEITNTGTVASSSTLRQICASVISEGGFELRSSKARTIGTADIAAGYSLSAANTFYPVVSLRLKSTNLDGIAILKSGALLPISAGNYRYKLVTGATITAGSWVSAGTDSIVEYNITGTGYTGGADLVSGFVSATNQSGGTISLSNNLLQYQLERNSLSSTPITLTLVACSDGVNKTVCGSVDWEEIT